MKIETFLPVFSGFYCNPYFETDEMSELDYINSQRENKGFEEIEIDLLTFDYDEYFQDHAKKCCEVVKSKINGDIEGLIKNVKFQKLVSPRFYNYSNDSINVEIDFNMNVLKAFLKENKESFKDYIKDRYTSCSGFISHYSNSSEDWIRQMNKKGFENKPHLLGSILNFICEELEINEEIFLDNGVYLYCTNFDELINTKKPE